MARRAAILSLACLLIGIGVRTGTATAGSTCGERSLAPRVATLHQLRSSLLCLINDARERRGLVTLRYSRELRNSATGHSRDMVRNRYFSHGGSRGSTMLARILRSGYSPSWIGEIIGGGPGPRYGSAIGIFRVFMRSGAHRANILDPRFRDFGVGVWRGWPYGGGFRAATYTIDFGTP